MSVTYERNFNVDRDAKSCFSCAQSLHHVSHQINLGVKLTNILPEITVTADYSGTFSTWGDCIYSLQNDPVYTNTHAAALSYFFSDSPFWDMNLRFASATPTQCADAIRYAAAIYDYLGPGWPKDIVSAFLVTSPSALYAAPTYALENTIWSVFKVTAHWLFGNGAPMSMHISEVDVKLSPSRIGAGTPKSLASFAATHRSPGTYTYDSGTYGYSTYDDSNLVSMLILGGITLRTIGTFQRNSNGTYTFTGITFAYADYFNMDKRPGRPWWADTVVDTFSAIGGQDFKITSMGLCPQI